MIAFRNIKLGCYTQYSIYIYIYTHSHVQVGACRLLQYQCLVNVKWVGFDRDISLGAFELSTLEIKDLYIEKNALSFHFVQSDILVRKSTFTCQCCDF